MNTEPIVVAPWVNLRQWVEDYVYRHHRKAFPVVNDGRLEGIITTQVLSNYPRDEWDRHTVGEVMRHDVGALGISPRADALVALVGLFLLVVSVVSLSGPGRIDIIDGEPRYEVARSLVEHGDVVIRNPEVTFLVMPGRNGRPYSLYRLPQSLAGVAAILLADA